MTPQQEIDTLRVMLGKALGALHDYPAYDVSDTTEVDRVVEEIEAMGIEPIGLPQPWEHPDVIAKRQRNRRILQQRFKLMEDYGLVKRVAITRDDIINDRLFN